MAWWRPGDEPLSEPMVVISFTHICVTRLQWVNDFIWLDLRMDETLVWNLILVIFLRYSLRNVKKLVVYFFRPRCVYFSTSVCSINSTSSGKYQSNKMFGDLWDLWASLISLHKLNPQRTFSFAGTDTLLYTKIAKILGSRSIRYWSMINRRRSEGLCYLGSYAKCHTCWQPCIFCICSLGFHFVWFGYNMSVPTNRWASARKT